MIYDLSDGKETDEAFKRLKSLAIKEAKIELIHISPKRTLNQNNYLHLVLSVFALEFSWTLEEAKWLYKKLNKSIYFYKKGGEIFFRSSADISKEDMATSIDVFITYAGEQGVEIPPATDQDWWKWATNESEIHKHLLKGGH